MSRQKVDTVEEPVAQNVETAGEVHSVTKALEIVELGEDGLTLVRLSLHCCFIWIFQSASKLSYSCSMNSSRVSLQLVSLQTDSERKDLQGVSANVPEGLQSLVTEVTACYRCVASLYFRDLPRRPFILFLSPAQECIPLIKQLSEGSHFYDPLNLPS